MIRRYLLPIVLIALAVAQSTLAQEDACLKPCKFRAVSVDPLVKVLPDTCTAKCPCRKIPWMSHRWSLFWLTSAVVWHSTCRSEN